MRPTVQKSIKANQRATSEWVNEAKLDFVNAPIFCSSGEWFLDHAVAGGNMEVIQWLLDQGANPNAGRWEPKNSYESIFFRCPHPRLDRRPDGLTPEQAVKKTFQAYQYLISKGADINRQLDRGGSFSRGATNALVKCYNDDMIPMLLELGINRSPTSYWDGNVQEEFDAESKRYAPLQEALWSALTSNRSLKRAEMLAHGGFNDLRGTKIEKRLRDDCDKEKYRKICSDIGSIVQLSKKTIPWLDEKNANNAKGKTAAKSTRRTCAFSELGAYADYDLVSIAATGEDIPAIEVSINKPGKPLFLFLESLQMKQWKIRHTKQTQIIGVVARSNGAVPDEVLGLEMGTPVYVGRDCSGFIDFRGGTPKLVRRYASMKSTDPFGRADLPAPLIVEGYRVFVGTPQK